MSKKNQTVFICESCGYSTSKWMGRCSDCKEWNTLVEEKVIPKIKGQSRGPESKFENIPRALSEISEEKRERIKTNISEFDRVVGGGMIKGSLALIGGEPGIGKSTLLVEVMGKLAKENSDKKILYISGEESLSQIATRTNRLGIDVKNLYLLNETNWENILKHIQKMKPYFIVLDSIQTTVSGEITSPPGTISQIREVTYQLMSHVKREGITCFIVGHITKGGAIAGPKVLEHMVDTVIYFEGDQFGHYRLLRVVKNRFGNTNEVGIFEMADSGLKEVKNPAQCFLEEHIEGSFGRSLTCILEGTRSLFVEIQALVVENQFGNGRRTTQGLDSNRLSMLVAIIEKYFGMPIGANDIYLNIVGGMKLKGREADLSIIASLLSSYQSKPVDHSTIFIGEVGLTGEVRSVSHMDLRLKEIAQMNYKRVVTSQKVARDFKGKYKLELIGIKQAKQISDYI